ncbi:SWI5-dependent HO expression protein 4 [Marasmius crinis-equi]|uniref:SWI5-dependent HO expression protein 4 n=1 Tax=Marasmius crinis-equi TaxID=585013 RepID=A0ABR3FZU3_9AGAR
MTSNSQQLVNEATQSLRLPEELSYIINAFSPSSPSDGRSKAYLVLSAFCQGVRQSHSSQNQQVDGSDPATQALARVFSPLILGKLEETNENDSLGGISFLTALFQVDWQAAASIFQQETLLELIMDSVDLNPSAELSVEVAHLLGQASGYKTSRLALSPEAIAWLERARSSKEPALRAAGAIAIIKLAKGTITDIASDPTAQKRDTASTNVDGLVGVMKQLVIDEDSGESSLSDAVEGLAYMSVDPTVKEDISRDAPFLKRLFTLVPKRKSASSAETSSTLLYGVVVIIGNICAYRPQLTEEQKQMEKLRKMAKSSDTQGKEVQDALDNDDKVKERIKRMLAAGAMDVLASVAPQTDTVGVRLSIGKAMLDIVTDKENRGKVLQHGGTKILMELIKKATATSPTPNKEKSSPDAVHLEPIQALAKLAITSSPVQVFGPNVGAIYDAIRPLSTMIQHSSATQLQRFEGLMALTNLASASPEIADRAAGADGLLNKVETLVLDDHPLVQRAAVELICNLIVGSDNVFEKYSSSKSKIQIIVALSDAEDIQTRLASSGALATLLSSPSACKELLSLQFERHRVLPLLTQLIDPSVAPDNDDTEPHPGLVHRGVICARQFVLGVSEEKDREKIGKEAKEVGLVEALGNVVKGAKAGPEVVGPASEVLQFLQKYLDSSTSK